MAYHIYQTEGLVLRGLPEGEGSKYVEIFTRDLGLVGAHATSIRTEKSKLRYALQDWSFSHIALVHGKLSWRVVNAVPDENFFYIFQNDPKRKSAFLRILKLVRKLIHGEEKNTLLYETIIGSLQALEDNQLTEENIIDIQLLSALRILNHLGYGVTEKNLKIAAMNGDWHESRSIVEKLRTEAKNSIKKSLSETHL